MWTLWAGFAYIFAALFWSLVVGYKNWGRVEYTAVAGGPLLYATLVDASTEADRDQHLCRSHHHHPFL